MTNLVDSAVSSLRSRFYVDPNNGSFNPKICAVCDRIDTVDNPIVNMVLDDFIKMCRKTGASKEAVKALYPAKVQAMVDCYTARDSRLAEFVLSPRALVCTDEAGIENIGTCTSCRSQIDPRKSHPPTEAIWNGHCIGEVPYELSCLNKAELALLSPNRVMSHGVVLYADMHAGVFGWHSIYENNIQHNISCLNRLDAVGFTGSMVVVLCGPFTSTQDALARSKYTVNREKMIQAYNWMEQNMHGFERKEMPDLEDLPQPIILRDPNTYKASGAGTQDIENSFNVTILFPDSDIHTETNGGFASQDEFREFVFKHGENRISHSLHSRPSTERKQDYDSDQFVRCFPLQFPYGICGFPRETALSGFRKKNRSSVPDTLRLLLRHRRAEMHLSEFNLMVGNVLMRQSVFGATRLQCNLRFKDITPLGEKYGMLTPDQLSNSVNKARAGYAPNRSADVGDQFLGSISAVCRELPHSNEAAARARSDYFSMLAWFGLPALFVTINPDDQRSFWLRIYLLREPDKYASSAPTSETMTDSDLLFRYCQRAKDRVDYPGLCAEDYIAITDIFIKDFLAWDIEMGSAKGESIFGEVDAWTQATEEQGRKTLHGHFLIWVKGWNELLHRLMTNPSSSDEQTVKSYVSHCSSASVFRDFSMEKPFQHVAPFRHTNCRNSRQASNSRFTVSAVSEAQFVLMRDAKTCDAINGHIADCPKCGACIGIHDVIRRSLDSIFSGHIVGFEYPDNKKRKLEQLCYDMQHDFTWHRDPVKRAKRSFAFNALTNIHGTKHSARCFKKSTTCYSGFPREPQNTTHIYWSTIPGTWTDWKGTKSEKRIFEVVLQRSLQDVYTNVHSVVTTDTFGCNTNVLSAMTGSSVMYVTSYNSKKTQKDERIAYEAMASTLLKVLRNEYNSNDNADYLPHQVGFRRLLLAVYVHTNKLVIAGPLSHYLSIRGSRYRFSHPIAFLPIRSLSGIMFGDYIKMSFTKVATDRKPFCRSLDYLYRPDQFETMSPHEFWSAVRSCTNKIAETTMLHPVYKFKTGHPKIETMVCYKTLRPVVPNIDWTFLVDTKKLTRPLLHRRRPGSTTPIEEEWAKRFMLAFDNYRIGDSMRRHGSYVTRLRHRHLIDRRYQASLPFADNIQNIRNSLEAGQMNNHTPSTCQDQYDTEDEAPDDGIENMVAGFFAEDTSAPLLVSEPNSFTFRTTPLVSDTVVDIPTATQTVMKNVITHENAWKASAKELDTSPRRFVAPFHGLNTLCKQVFIIGRNEEGKAEPTKATGTAENIIKFGMARNLDEQQRQAYEVLTATFVLSFIEDSIGQVDPSDRILVVPDLIRTQRELVMLAHPNRSRPGPLRLFLTGPAGAGKSTILESLVSYAQSYCRSIGHAFDEGLIRLTALTGSAATEIKGRTVHSVCKLGRMSKITTDDIEKWKNTRLLVIDEISFGGYDTFLLPMSKNLQLLTEDHSTLFGSVPIVFIGDFLQLCPPGGQPIYQADDSIYWEEALNIMIELRGQWRFDGCQYLGHAFTSIRQFGLTDETRTLFRSRVIGHQFEGQTVRLPDIRSTKIATFHNHRREVANNAVFDKHLAAHHSMIETDPVPKFTVIIKAHATWVHNHKPLSFGQKLRFYEDVKESHTKDRSNGKSVDPFLRLYYNCEVMYRENDDVGKGVANGTTATFQSITLKPGKYPHKIRYNGYFVYAVNAEDVDFMRLQWTTDSTFRGTFCIAPKSKTYNVKIRRLMDGTMQTFTPRIKILQFSITRNNATTGHKLQGKTVKRLIIKEWSLVRNWIYVVLSRVTSINQLYLFREIPSDADTEPPDLYIAMMDRIRQSLPPLVDSDEIFQIRSRL